MVRFNVQRKSLKLSIVLVFLSFMDLTVRFSLEMVNLIEVDLTVIIFIFIIISIVYVKIIVINMFNIC